MAPAKGRSAPGCAAASGALAWLGGSEDQVALRRCMQTLLGQWRGQDGSIYTLTKNGDGRINVETLRPNGWQRFTRGLITLRADPRRRCGAAVAWGAPHNCFELALEGGTAVWRRGRQMFVWSKVQ